MPFLRQKNVKKKFQSRLFVGTRRNNLLTCGAMIADLLTLGIWWHAIQTYPGLLEAVGYFYGILVACFSVDALDAYMSSDLE